MPDSLDAYLDPPSPRNPRDRVHSIASKIGLSPDIADDYYKLTNVESGHNVNVRNSSKGAQGFGQVMPDVKGGTTRTVGGRKYNLRDPDQNITAGLSYFAEGGSDPVARRLYYFGGPRAKQHYEKTGRIPNISDGNMSASQYVKATGAQRAQKPKDDFDSYLDPIETYLDPVAAPIVATRFGTNAPVQNGPVRGSRKPVNRFAGLAGGVDVLKRPDQRGQPATSSLSSDELRVMKGEQPVDRAGYTRGTLPASVSSPQRQAEERLGAMQARDAQRAQAEHEDWQQKNAQAIADQTAEYRADIQKAKARGGDPNKWLAEMGTKGGAGFAELVGGVVKPAMPGLSNKLRVHAEAAQRAAQEEGADRNAVSKFAQDVAGGFVASAPELAAMSAGIPAPLVFGAGSGARAYGGGRPVAPAAAHGALTGAAFEVPVEGALAKGATVGGLTTALDTASGQPIGEALKSGGVNALMAAAGGRNAKTATIPEVERSQPTREAAATARDVRQGAMGDRGADVRGVSAVSNEGVRSNLESGISEGQAQSQDLSGVKEPQHFYHRDWGEVVEAPDQSGARVGRVKVAEVDNPDNLHFPKKSDLRGSGNIRMVPIKEVPTVENLPAEVQPPLSASTPEVSARQGVEQSAPPSKDLEHYLNEAQPSQLSPAESAPRDADALPKLSATPRIEHGGKAINLDEPVPQDVLTAINRTFNQMVGPDIYSELPKNPTTQDVIELLANVGLSDQIMQESVPKLRKLGYSRIGDVLITDEGLKFAPKELPPAPIEQPSTPSVAAAAPSQTAERSFAPETKESVPRIVARTGEGAGGRGAPETPAPSITRRPSRLRGKSTLVTGERSDITLSQFVRKRGGIAPGSMFRGELERISPKETGTTGLVNRNNRGGGGAKMTADYMMEAANEAGFGPYENVGDFLYDVGRDATGDKIQALVGDEIDFDKEYRKHAERDIADEKDRRVAQQSAERLVGLIEGGRGGELFDKITANNATDAEHQELRTLARKNFVRSAELEGLINEAKAEGVSTSFESVPQASPASRGARAEQLGFVQEGLEQQSAPPPKVPDQRERLIRAEQQRQRAANPEKAAAQDTLASIRERGMTVDDYARQGSLTGEVPSPEKIEMMRGLERGKGGQAGFLNVNPRKRGHERARSPVLQEVERATRDGENKWPSLRQRAQQATSYLQRSLVSEFSPLRDLEQTLYGRNKVPVVDMARKFEQVAGAPAKAQADIIDFRKNVVDPIRKSADDFNSYLFLKRVEDRLLNDSERKRVAGWTAEKAQQGLAELKSKVGEDTYSDLERAGQSYQAEMDKALRLQVESGRMSQESYEAIKNSNDFYAPFKVLRYIDDAAQFRGSGRRVATTQELSKKITGIDSEDFQLGNILQASAEQIVRSRILAEKNLKMLELDKLADLDASGDLIKRVDESKPRPRQGYEFVRFFKDGDEQILEVDHTVANAIQGLNPKQASMIAQTMALAKKPLQVGATSANAGFQAVNLFFADLPRAALVSRYGVSSPKDIVRFPADWAYSLFTSVKGNFGKPNQLYMDWLRSGAANSTVQRELTPEAFRPTLGIAKPGVRHLGRSVLDSVAKFSNAIEETSKVLGIKRGMRAEGYAKLSLKQRQQAMEKIATEVRNYSGSPDFARKGSETRDLNLLFMFFNARLQGVASDVSRLAGKTGGKEGAAAWARLGVGIALPSTLLAIVNNLPGNKDDYDKIPDWEKKNYWMIPRNSHFTNEDTGDQVRDYWRIPKRELGQLIGNTTESAVDFAMRRDPKEAKKWAVEMIENMSPINIQGQTAGERLESVFGSTNPALKLPAELLMNRDTFRHRDIVPEYMKKAAPEEQYRASTPYGYVRAGRVLGVSPLRLEHAAEGLTGSAASQFSVREKQPGRSSLSQYPVLRRFVRSGSVATDTGMGERLQQAEQDETTESVRRRRQAQSLVSLWHGASDADVRRNLASMARSDPKLAQKVWEIRKQDEKGLTSTDRQIAALGIENGERQKFIEGELSRMATQTEKDAFIADLKRKGLYRGGDRPTRQSRAESPRPERVARQ